MSTYYQIQNGAIASGPHDVRSEFVKRLTNCGNPELLDLALYGLVPEVRATLAAGQVHGAPVLAGNGLSVSVPAVDRPLADLKAERIEADRQECQKRIDSVWPAARQISLALGGIYDAADEADCIAWVTANIDASNAARDIINAASTDTPEKIAAVVVAWPTYTGG